MGQAVLHESRFIIFFHSLGAKNITCNHTVTAKNKMCSSSTTKPIIIIRSSNINLCNISSSQRTQALVCLERRNRGYVLPSYDYAKKITITELRAASNAILGEVLHVRSMRAGSFEKRFRTLV